VTSAACRRPALTGSDACELAKVDLSRVVRGGIDRAGVAARVARSRLEADLQEGVVGTWDRLALDQAAENLLSNALKFGAGKPVGVTLRADARAARLTIRDCGMGISEEDRAHIFERAVARREHGGFGVRLWLANQLVTAMAGAIAVESAPGEGTTFTVTVPLGGSEQEWTSAA
jgi:two-component system, OmpR family, sensor kinase